MPVYEYRCPQGHITEEYKNFSQYREPVTCRCGLQADRAIITPPRVFGDYEGYESPASGRWIEGRRAREEDFKRTGTRPYELGEKEDLVRRQALVDKQIDAVVDNAVEQTLHELTA